MSVYVLWLPMLALKGLLVVSLLRTGLYKKYVGFYSYITVTMLLGLSRLYIYALEPQSYLAVYWWTQFVIVAAGFGVTWEIFSSSLRHYPGVRKMARVLVTGAFVAVMLQFVITALTGPIGRGVMRLERDMRAVEILLLVTLVLLIVYYAIPLGRNLLGLIFGYGLYLASTMVTLTLHTVFGPSSQIWLDVLRQTCEIFAVLIWLTALWRFFPTPIPLAPVDLEEDYTIVAQRTTRAIAFARQQLIRLFTV